MSDHIEIDCAAADELAPAFGLDALTRAEQNAVAAHLDSCAQPHELARELIAAASLVPETLERVTPSSGLRDRLMASVAATPQDHRQSAPAASRPAYVEAPAPARRAWWQWGALPSALAAVGLAAAVGLGAWNVSLSGQLTERETALRAVASADAAFMAKGEAGRGWVIQTGDTAYFIAEGLAALDAGQLYELWVIDGEGTPIAAGVTTDTDGVVLVALDLGLDGATAFAVTVETERVDQPSGAPVLLAPLDA